MAWRQLSAACVESRAEALSDRLFELGALSVSLQDEGDQALFEPRPGEIPLWRETRIIALFPDNTELGTIRTALEDEFDAEDVNGWVEEEIRDQAWERAWMDHFHSMRFGRRLWIIPTGFDPPDQTEAVCVSLDPGLAFGTGSHPTTSLCLEWLEGLELKDKDVLDYGCGSGILGIAALMLGAGSVVAADIEPQALTATSDNAHKNGVEGRLHCCLPNRLPQLQTDILLANILANPLIELSVQLSGYVRLGGKIALSGILREQTLDVLHAYEPFFVMEAPEFREDWAFLTGVRRGG